MPDHKKAFVYVIAPVSRIRTKELMYQTALKINALKRSRLGTTDWLHVRLFEELDVPVYKPYGVHVDIHRDIIDEAYGWTDEFRWNSDVKKFVEKYPQRKPNWHLMPRLELWDLAFKIMNDPIKF
ncbi:MAG: hypothetical protein AAFW83_01690 [Pseudomonadota bacterium]